MVFIFVSRTSDLERGLAARDGGQGPLAHEPLHARPGTTAHPRASGPPGPPVGHGERAGPAGPPLWGPTSPPRLGGGLGARVRSRMVL